MFQFPASPTIGQVFTPIPGLDYAWNGKGWVPPSFSMATTPILHADGTLAAPGISWVNEPNAGFRRVSTGTFQSVVGGNWIYGWNATGFTLNTGVGFYAGAATFSGNVTGITKAMVGLGNVLNEEQVYNFAPANARLSLAWDGSMLVQRRNTEAYSSTWPIHITGNAGGNCAGYADRALRVHRGANPGDGSIAFHWSGQGGQPTWLWGSPDDPNNTYVYNPSNFHVRRATDANNADAVNGISGWSYGDWGNNPAYLWVTEGNSGQQHLTRPGSINVNYANSSNTSNRVGSLEQSQGGMVHGNITTNRIYMNDDAAIHFNNTGYYLNIAIGNPSWNWMYSRFRHAGGQWAGQDWDIGGSYFELRAGGAATKAYGGQWDGQSDIRLKHNVRSLAYGLNEIVRLKPIEFELDLPNMETFPKRDIVGVSAQDVELVMPKMVYREPHEELGEVLCIRPDYVQYALVNAVKELAERLTALENK